MENNTKSNGGYCWVVVASAFTIGFVIDGVSYTFGILMIELLTQFQEDRAKTVLIISVMQGTRYLLGPLTGALCERHGHRVVVFTGTVIASIGLVISVFADGILFLTLTYGVLGGLGFGLVYPARIICVLQHFEKRRALATGIVACGSGVGNFCVSRLLPLLIDYYGWRGTILIEAAIVMQCAVCGLLLTDPVLDKNTRQTNSNGSPLKTYDNNSGTKELNESSLGAIENKESAVGEQGDKENPSPKDSNIKEQNLGLVRYCKSLFRLELLRDIRCWVFIMSTVMFSMAYQIPFNFLPDQGTEDGMSKDDTVWLISSIGISNTVSRAFLGWIGDLHFINRLVLLMALSILAALSTGFSIFLRTFALKISYACFYGFFIGGFITLAPVVLLDVFGVKMISTAYGLLMFSIGISHIISTPIGGWLFDITGNYDFTFVLSGVEFLLSGLLLLGLHIYLKRG